jgi:pyruvate,water dikinase
MDIEWAKDGLNNHILFRPTETIYGKEKTSSRYTNSRERTIITQGIALVTKSPLGKLEYFIILKKEINCWKAKFSTLTNPDWDPILKKAAAIITNKGGRTSHAAIVAGTGNCRCRMWRCHHNYQKMDNKSPFLCRRQRRYVYDGKLEWEITEQDFSQLPCQKQTPCLFLPIRKELLN